MKKIRFWLLSIIFVFAFLAGCSGNNEEANNEEKDATIHVTLSKNDGEEIILEEDLEISEGDILLDVMEEHFDVTHEGGFINSINGIAPKDPNKEGWLYFVNDEMAPVGAAEYELSDEEKVRFDFQKWN